MDNTLHPDTLMQTTMPLPDGNPKSVHGVQKTPLHLIPPPAMIAEAEVFKLGARKYGAYNWRIDPVSASVYQAAAMRHLLAWWEGQDIDAESGQSHLAHARACLGILLDAGHHGTLRDDRPLVPAHKPDADQSAAHYANYGAAYVAAGGNAEHLHGIEYP